MSGEKRKKIGDSFWRGSKFSGCMTVGVLKLRDMVGFFGFLFDINTTWDNDAALVNRL